MGRSFLASFKVTSASNRHALQKGQTATREPQQKGTFLGDHLGRNMAVLEKALVWTSHIPTGMPQTQARKKKKSTKINFLGRRLSGGVGVFHAKGWGSKSSRPPSKVCFPWVSREGSWDILGVLPGCPGPSLCKKVLAHFSFSTNIHQNAPNTGIVKGAVMEGVGEN